MVQPEVSNLVTKETRSKTEFGAAKDQCLAAAFHLSACCFTKWLIQVTDTLLQERSNYCYCKPEMDSCTVAGGSSFPHSRH